MWQTNLNTEKSKRLIKESEYRSDGLDLKVYLGLTDRYLRKICRERHFQLFTRSAKGNRGLVGAKGVRNGTL